ncbi:MAG: hypothetical protein U0271_06485 [Polyangiaceae bacterium]
MALVAVTEDGWRLPVTRYRGEGPAVLLATPEDPAANLARFLATAGFDVFSASLRTSAGAAPPRAPAAAPHLSDVARYDVPALVACALDAAHDAPLAWVGHGVGGTAALLAGAARDAARAIATLGSPIATPAPPSSTRTLARLVGRWLGRVDSQSDFAADLHALGGCEQLDRGLATPIPKLFIVGQADSLAPADRTRERLEASDARAFTLVEFGTLSGHACTYGHLDLVRADSAPREVFPMLASWLHATLDARPEALAT